MKYIIRKVPERDTSYIERLIPGAEIYCDETNQGPIKSFVSAMKMADDDAVYIQDDMILCKDFKARCDDIVSKHKNEVVQLSNFTFHNSKTRILHEGYYEPWQVPWCLCVYIPKRISSLFVELYENGSLVPTAKELKGQADDWLLARVVEYAGEKEYLVVPNLAGHPLNTSTVLSERDKQIRLCMNFEYDKAEPVGDMEKELFYYRRDFAEYESLRKGR